MGTAQVIEWLSTDGIRLHGALLLPPGAKAGKRYPLLVWSYPQSSESNRFDHFGFDSLFGPMNMQLYATRGYAVLSADTHPEAGAPSAGLARSVLPGVNKVIEMGLADPERVGLIGHSNGGYAVLALLTETKRFNAAVEVSGYGDFVSSYGVMLADGTAYRMVTVEGLLGKGGPWQFPLRYFDNSPIFHLDSVETPLLMAHGTQDEDIASFLADEVFVGLRALGKEVEYARYEGEGHAPRDWSYSNQLDLANRIIGWFDSHLKCGRELAEGKCTGAPLVQSTPVGGPTRPPHMR
jgi:dipeptidyl aminopeptidase/acylaminoacyl peptidase